MQRFLTAHEQSYQIALKEIQNGRKTSHWMWFIFPQLAGLGKSMTSQFYDMKDIKEAMDYLNHPVLGEHLVEISKALLTLESNNALDVLGSPDNLKLRSSMTLFSYADPDNPVFQQVLDKFFGGRKDERTLRLLGLKF